MNPALAMRPARRPATEAQRQALNMGRRVVLTPAQVAEIRADKSRGSGKIFAINLHLSEAQISRIRTGKRWGTLPR